MPKSKVRKKARTSRPTPPTSPMAQALAFAERLLHDEATRVQAEVLASEVLGNLVAHAKGADARARRAAALDTLVTGACRRKTPAAAALLTAVQLIVENPAVEQDWTAELLTERSWPQAPVPQPTGARRVPDVYDDHVIWLLDYEDCILAASTARWFHQGVLSVSVLLPGPIGDIDADATQMPVEEAVRALRDGQQYTEMLWPPHDEPDYEANGLALAARLRAISLPEEEPAPWQPLPTQARTELLDAFFADLGMEDAAASRVCADLCLTFGEHQIDGDPLAWSPDIVEAFLLEWLPVHADHPLDSLLATVTYAWVGWALVRRGLSKELAQEAAQVALDLVG